MRTFGPGDRVTHFQYGDGTVDSVNEYHTKITFDEHGLRTFVSSRVELTRATTGAPVKAPTRRRRTAASA
jgi:hypothetical protein